MFFSNNMVYVWARQFFSYLVHFGNRGWSLTCVVTKIYPFLAKYVLGRTTLWNVKKERWINGPKLLNFNENKIHFYTINSSMFCAVAVNSTSVILIGSQIYGLQNELYVSDRSIMFNFENNSWKLLPKMPIGIDACQCAVMTFQKSGERYILEFLQFNVCKLLIL